MLLQKLQRAFLRRFRVVARPIIAVETVACVVPEDRHLGIRRGKASRFTLLVGKASRLTLLVR
jgi:hypothetical protein